MVIDFHTHCYKDELAARAMALIPKDKPGPFYDGTLTGLVGFMKQNGISHAVNLHIANKPEHTVNVNNWAINCNKERGVVAFGSINPFFDGYRDELKRLTDHGIKGLKFHPYYQKYEVDDSAALKVYDACANAGMILLFHTGLDSMAPGEYGTTDKFAKVVDALRYDKIVAAHLGGSLTLDKAERLIWGKNIYLDTSLSFRFLSDEARLRLLNTHDNSKLLFGSDAPWADCETDFKAFDNCPHINKELKEKIYFKNAAALLGLSL